MLSGDMLEYIHMKQLFDKDFFTFTLGFLMIIVASMTLLAITGYYKTQIEPVAATALSQ